MSIDADEYQEACKETAIYPKDSGLVYTILGLGNEAGELQGKYKKWIRDGTSLEDLRKNLIAELGDVLWYAAMLAYELDVNLSTVMERNLLKLQDRKIRGTLGGSGDQR